MLTDLYLIKKLK